MFLAVMLAFALLCANHRDAVWVADSMSVASTVNLLLFYDLGGHALWKTSAPMANGLLIAASVAASVVNVLLWFVLVFGRGAYARLYRPRRLQPWRSRREAISAARSRCCR